MIKFLIGFLVFTLSIVSTKFMRGLLLRFSIIDMPNHRSMHDEPTPRGGGVVIALFSLITSVILYRLNMINNTEFFALSIPLVMTLIVTLLDDKFSLSIKVRTFFYFLAAIIFLYFINTGWDIINSILAVFFIVWIMNLYNFMDGIDGIAGVEAITTLLFGLFIFEQTQAQELFYISLVLFASTAGFLIWNWPPAKIFLGDVGSCSLGLWFSMIAIWSYLKYEIPIEIWLVLLSVFIADASFTLSSRILSGKKWYQAHKEHAYQKLISSGFSHKSVDIYVILFNVLITWPLAYWIYLYRHHSVFVVLLNYAILLIFWYKTQHTK